MNFGVFKTLVKNFALIAVAMIACQQAKTQTVALEECFGDDDLYGKAWFANPNDVTLPDPGPDNLVFTIEGCLVPSQVDYDDLFSFQVPEGYVLESIHFSEMNALFDITELNFYFWIGDDCKPVFEPDASFKGLQNGEPTGTNMISSLTPLGPGWYSGWIDMDLPSTTTYVLVISLACNDNVAPTFTTNAGALDGAAECSNQAAIDALLAMEPAGADNNGAVEVNLISDETTPNPACPNAYTRVRTWSLTDGCGNSSEQNFVQTITVSDNTGPELQLKNAEVTITDPAGYVLTAADIVVDAYDLCGDDDVNISFNPSVLTCAQINTVVAVTVIAEDACGNQTEAIAQVSVAEDTSIKAPWHNDNIGNTANGSATHSVCSDGFTVKSKGFSMPQSDVAHFAYVELCGNGEITVQVTSLAPAGGWAGVMIRESLAPGAKKVAVRTNLANAIRRDVRTMANGTTQTQQSVIVPGQHWLRLNRNGNTISVYVATDGNQWSLLGAVPVTMGNCVLMGMFVESTNNNLEITGAFDNVSVSGGIQALVMPDDDNIEEAQSKLQAKQANTQAQPELPGMTAGQVSTTAIKAFPNPSSGDFQLDLAGFEGQDIDVQIIDVAGKTVATKHINGAANTEAFNLNGAMPGLYLITVRSADGQQTATAKLVLAR